MAGGAVILCCAASWWDLRTRRIPNALTLSALVIALCLHSATGAGQGLLLSACGALAAGALLIPGYLFRFTGAGDVKLLMAVGAFLSFPLALKAALASLLVGGVIGVFTAIRYRRLGEVLARSVGLARWIASRAAGASTDRPATSSLRVPFGVAIALATAVTLFIPRVGGAQ